MDKKTAVIIGAGPAGLTAAYELLTKTDIKPVIYEMSNKIGGISKTVDFKGNKIDIGGHRFFSKSQRVMQWWQDILPLQGKPSKDDIILRRKIQFSTKINAPDPEKTDKVMLIRNRLSRIFFLGNFFDDPLSLNFNTFSNLDLFRIIKIGLSYIKIRLYPIKKEKSLEDFFINRFGKELYLLFFKDYTEKVWGIPCNKISPEWGAQRIKGLSITKAIFHGLNTPFSKNRSISQKNTETSLIQQFMYPKLGPGQLWDEVAGIIKRKGGKIYLKHKVIGLKYKNNKIVESRIKDQATGKVKTQKGDYFFSTMPVKDLIQGLGEQVPQEVQEVAKGLGIPDSELPQKF